MDHARLNIHGWREEFRDRYLRSEVRRVFSPDAAPWDLVNDTADDRLPFTLSAAWVTPEADDSAPESLPTPHPRPIHDPNPETNATAIDTSHDYFPELTRPSNIPNPITVTSTTTLTTSNLTIISAPNPIPAHPQIQETEIQTQHCQSCTCQTSTPPRYPHDPTPISNLSMMPPPHAEPSLSSTNPFRPPSSIPQDTFYHPLDEGRACGLFRIWQIAFAGNPDEDGEEFLETLAECATGQNLTQTEILRVLPFVLTGSARAWAQEQPRKWSNYNEFLRAFRLRYVPNNYQTRSIRPVADHSPPSSPPSPKRRKALPKSDTPPTTLPRPRKTLFGPHTSPTPSISPRKQPLKTNGSAPPRSSSPFHTSNASPTLTVTEIPPLMSLQITPPPPGSRSHRIPSLMSLKIPTPPSLRKIRTPSSPISPR
ncbi:mucin-2-like [Osmia bicornis bicornis]|uniref:mucin-2-like n=1 Tax=Osmia bicornis bicornis TaxID=1437191 RepID=UPI001EAEB177|nr:mucin-2-like [Osmia bicornis bicornis]